MNNIKEIKLNDTVVFSYEYDVSTGNLIKQTYGENSDAFIFEYNNENLISSIYYQPKGGSKTLNFKYFYNEDKQLSRVEDADGNLLNEYKYDENNRVESVKTNNSEIKNTYDNLFKNDKVIIQKTDNQQLFEFSLVSLSEYGYTLQYVSLDYHHSGSEDIIMTEYERKFSEKGISICRLVAVKKMSNW